MHKRTSSSKLWDTVYISVRLMVNYEMKPYKTICLQRSIMKKLMYLLFCQPVLSYKHRLHVLIKCFELWQLRKTRYFVIPDVGSGRHIYTQLMPVQIFVSVDCDDLFNTCQSTVTPDEIKERRNCT